MEFVLNYGESVHPNFWSVNYVRICSLYWIRELGAGAAPQLGKLCDYAYNLSLSFLFYSNQP